MIFQVNDSASLQTCLDKLCEYLAMSNVEQEKIFDCKLVACELLGNVLKHGDGKGDLNAVLQEEYVVLKVQSNTVFQLPKQIECSGLFSENGRGLFLVNTLCEGQVYTEGNAILAKIRIKK